MGTPRNALCPCGSGKKFKRCHGAESPPLMRKAAEPPRQPLKQPSPPEEREYLTRSDLIEREHEIRHESPITILTADTLPQKPPHIPENPKESQLKKDLKSRAWEFAAYVLLFIFSLIILWATGNNPWLLLLIVVVSITAFFVLLSSKSATPASSRSATPASTKPATLASSVVEGATVVFAAFGYLLLWLIAIAILFLIAVILTG